MNESTATAAVAGKNHPVWLQQKANYYHYANDTRNIEQAKSGKYIQRPIDIFPIYINLLIS